MCDGEGRGRGNENGDGKRAVRGLFSASGWRESEGSFWDGVGWVVGGDFHESTCDYV